MDLSIIIVSWNVWPCLKKCLESIYRNTNNLDVEIFVIDNNSEDGTKNFVSQKFPFVRFISNSQNIGFAKACNQGLKMAKGRYVLLLNPDTEILDDCLKVTVDFMDQYSEVGLAGCKILNPDGTLQRSIRRLPNFLVHLGMMFKLHHFFRFSNYFANDFDYEQLSDVEQIMGAFMMIRRSVIDKLGYLDEKYHLWFEEVDYCFQAKKQGIKVVYLPTAKIIHYGAQSFDQAGTLTKQYYFCLSRLYYLFKNSNLVLYIIILVLTPISLLLSLVASLKPKHVK